MTTQRLPDPPMPPLPDQQDLVDTLALHTCTRNCWGTKGHAADCCRLGDRDFVQGPVMDTDDVLAYLSGRYGRDVPFAEIFVEAEEGRAMFPDRPCWQIAQNYPALRPVPDASLGYPCRFLAGNGLCRIYDGRPAMCRNYKCLHLTAVLDLI